MLRGKLNITCWPYSDLRLFENYTMVLRGQTFARRAKTVLLDEPEMQLLITNLNELPFVNAMLLYRMSDTKTPSPSPTAFAPTPAVPPPYLVLGR